MAMPVMCWRCNSRHWTTQPCKAVAVAVRPMVAEFLSGKPASIPAAKPRTTAVVTEKTADTRRCECGTPIEKPERGPMPKFCTDTCRKRASRRKAS